MAFPPILVLDLDGTLVDTIGDLVATLNLIVAAEGIAPVTRESVRAIVGNGSRAMIEAAFAGAGRPLPAAKLEALFTAFIARYAAHIADESRPFPGAEAALDRFAAEGWRLAVCTNKLEGLSRELLARLGLADRFQIIAGQDTFGVRKPDPRHLTMTIRAAGGAPTNAVLVGDSMVDVATAKAANVPVVAVAFGYSAVPVAELGADRVIADFDALFDAVKALR